ncbi:hypothetical protein I4U23_010929 [Adineta vaga]|nr:hypothetical protein I4U23_010929 [Adineta vaga]
MESKRIVPKHQINHTSLSILPSTTNHNTITANVTTTLMHSTFTLDDQRNHSIKCIEEWSSLNENYLNLENFKLKEGQNENQAPVECQCKARIILGKLDDKLIPSNFYRYLKSSSCKFINRLLKEQKAKEDNNNNSSNSPLVLSSAQPSDNNLQIIAPSHTVNRKHSHDSTSKINYQKRQKC